MAFEANYGVSTVLEALCVTTAVGFLVPGECWATGYRRPAVHRNRAARTERGPSRQRHADCGLTVGDAAWGRQIRNSKFEIRAGILNSEFRIPNSTRAHRYTR